MIRKADENDIFELLGIVKLFSEDIGFGDHYCRKSTSQHLFAMVSSGVILVAVEDDQIAGVIGGAATRSPWNSGVLVFEEQLFYVLDEYRNRSIAHRLITEFTTIIADVEMSTLKLMHNSPDLTKFYNKLGYEKLETTFVKRR